MTNPQVTMDQVRDVYRARPPLDPTVELLASMIREQQVFFREVLATMAEVSKYAIQPNDAPFSGMFGPAPAKYVEPEEDIDPSDPMEAYLGVDFQREMTDIYDSTSDTPFGLPGIKADTPDIAEDGAD